MCIYTIKLKKHRYLDSDFFQYILCNLIAKTYILNIITSIGLEYTSLISLSQVKHITHIQYKNIILPMIQENESINRSLKYYIDNKNNFVNAGIHL